MPPDCPYCGNKAELVDSAVVYRKSHGNIWICHPCQAWVGVHQNDNLNRPLGRLADTQLRAWNKRAHDAFDPLWRRKMERDRCSKAEAIKAGYVWLANQLGISFAKCPIKMFDVAKCMKVVLVCSPGNLELIALTKKSGLPHDTKSEDEGGECRCWLERQGDSIVIETVFDERTPDVCSQNAGRIIKRAC